MTLEELKNVPMHFHSHMAMEHEHTTTYFSDDGKIGFCSHMPFRNGEPRGRSYRHYIQSLGGFEKFAEWGLIRPAEG